MRVIFLFLLSLSLVEICGVESANATKVYPPGLNLNRCVDELPSFEIGKLANGHVMSIGKNAYDLVNLYGGLAPYVPSQYMYYQEATLHQTIPACNLFVYTVLYSMGLESAAEIPYARANQMPKQFRKSGWFEEITFEQFDAESRDLNYEWNIVMVMPRPGFKQILKNGVRGLFQKVMKHGHTLIPVGREIDANGNVDPKGSFIVAQGQYNGNSHYLSTYSRWYLKNGEPKYGHKFLFFKFKWPEPDEGHGVESGVVPPGSQVDEVDESTSTKVNIPPP